MKKITLALASLITCTQAILSQQISITTSGKTIISEGKQYSEYKEKDGSSTYSYKFYATVRDGNLIITNQKNSSTGSLIEVVINTIALEAIDYISSPQSPEKNDNYSPQIYSAIVALKNGKKYTSVTFNYEGNQTFTNTWNYPLFINTPSKDNITLINKAVAQKSMDGITFLLETNKTAVAQENSNTKTNNSNNKPASIKEEVKEIRIEVQNTSKEQIFITYEGPIYGSSFLGAGSITNYRAKPGAKIKNKKTGVVLVEVTANTKSGFRFKI